MSKRTAFATLVMRQHPSAPTYLTVNVSGTSFLNSQNPFCSFFLFFKLHRWSRQVAAGFLQLCATRGAHPFSTCGRIIAKKQETKWSLLSRQSCGNGALLGRIPKAVKFVVNVPSVNSRMRMRHGVMRRDIPLPENKRPRLWFFTVRLYTVYAGVK